MLITRGNGKLGAAIWAWSIPAGATCPGRSDLCFRLCYARRGHFAWSNAQKLYQRNLRFSHAANFVSLMCAAIRVHGCRTLRVHVSGDFYDAAYARKWLAIVKRNRRTTFFTYTRSWAIPEIRDVLQAMALERNCLVWWSWDRETGPAPPSPRVRHAYMAVNETDVPRYPTDLVFRVKRIGIQKWDAKGNLICPHENGATKLTCTQCRLCFTARTIPKKKAAACPGRKPKRTPKLTSTPRKSRGS